MTSIVNELETSLIDDARVIIYDRHMFIVQTTGLLFALLCGMQMLEIMHTASAAYCLATIRIAANCAKNLFL